MRFDVLQSGIWQTNSSVIDCGGAVAVIDPAYFPRELATLAELAAQRGPVAAVIFTHGHWDHVMGHAAFADAPVWLSTALDAAIDADAPRAASYLDDARDFDGRWYVPRPDGHRWPARRRGLADDQVVAIGDRAARIMHLTGHSPDGLGLLIDDVLWVGDHLSACEIPFVDDAEAYAATLRRLLGVLADGVATVVPGHGPRHTAAEAIAIARADLQYVERLLEAAASRADAAAFAAIPLPRAADVPGMRDHHRANGVKLGLFT